MNILNHLFNIIFSIFKATKAIIRRFQYETVYKYVYRKEIGSRAVYNNTIYYNEGSSRTMPHRPKILLIWPTFDQAKNGLLQSLKNWGKVTVYINHLSQPQYLLPGRDKKVGSAKTLRRLNTEGLLRYLQKDYYDIIFTQAWGFSFDFDGLRQIEGDKTKLINVCMDDRHLIHGAFAPLKLGSMSFSSFCDIVLTNVPESIGLHKRAGSKMTVFWPEAAGQDYFYPKVPFEDRDIDVLFIGQNYGERSKRVEALLRSGISVEAFGKGWPNGYVDNIPAYFQRAKIILGSSEIGYCKNLHHIKMRDFEAPMSGACYITRYHGDLSILYDIGGEIVTYSTIKEMVDKIKYLLSNPEEMAAIAAAGHTRAISYHTWDNRIKFLMST